MQALKKKLDEMEQNKKVNRWLGRCESIIMDTVGARKPNSENQTPSENQTFLNSVFEWFGF